MKGNPNPSPSTRFTAENHPKGGRPKGSRDKLSAEFISALCKDFEEHGATTVETVRTKDPATYLRVIAAIVPKEMNIKAPLDDVSDELLEALIAMARERVEGKPSQTMVN